MFFKIASFEFQYQLRNPVFWVVAGVFFLLTFGAMTIDGVTIGSGGNVNANAPVALIQTMLIMSLFFMFVTTAFVANTVVRDDQTGFGSMIRSSQVVKFDYLFGRFAGAFAAAALAFLVVPVGSLIGTLMPWLDQETLGPMDLNHYVFGYLFLALPSVLLTASLFFAVACASRSMGLSYIGVVVFLVLYFTLTGIAGGEPELRKTAALLEPFGLAAVEDATRYWSPSERNTQLPALAGPLLHNRLLAVGVSLLALGLAFLRFSFSERAPSRRSIARTERQRQRLAQVTPKLVSQLPNARPDRAGIARFAARTSLEMAQIFRSPAFFVLVVIGLANSAGALLYANELYGTAARPLTFALLEPLAGSFTIIPVIIAIFYAGELVWRDHDRGLNEIIDATSLPNWAYLLPKVTAVCAVLVVTIGISVVAAILVQLGKGHTNVELAKYLNWYLIPSAIEMLLLAVLAVVFQALSPNKYVGWGLMALYLVASITLYEMGFEHPLYSYGETFANPLSDLNGSDLGSDRAWLLRAYWMGVAIVLGTIAHLLWRRGTGYALTSRLKQLPRRLLGGPGLVALAGLTLAGTSGFYLFYQMNILNRYEVSDAFEERLADYEKKFRKYEPVLQPSITSVVLDADLYPHKGEAFFKGRYELINDTGTPVEELHVRLADSWTEMTSLRIPRGRISLDEMERYRYQIYRLNPPLAPGASTSMEFETKRVLRGFRANDQDNRLVRNGTFLNNAEVAPRLGFDRSDLLADRQTRRKYDLPAELRMPQLEDSDARSKNYVANADWVDAEITVTTRADQIPIAPGNKVSEVVEGDRRTVRFASDVPVLNFFSIQSAAYERVQRQADGLTLEVYHHPGHDYNVERMLDALEQSLAYYQEQFGPYQFDYARIIEFPGYESFAQAFAGTIPYSEKLGFIANLADGNSVDYVTIVTAHEAAHQYWAHQLISAYAQGGTMLVESLAQYSAFMVMKRLYGPDSMRRFLKYDLDRYLSGRGSEAIEEVPLNRVENQGYIHYRKGGHVLYLLQDRLGEERVNGMLAELLDQYRFKSQPYPNSSELVNGYKQLARDAGELRLIEDVLEKITFYDLSASRADVRTLPDGRFETTVAIAAAKHYADGYGDETEAKLDQLIEVGVFRDRPGFDEFAPEDVLASEWHPIRSGEQVVKIITDERPIYAGVDPFSKFIDKNGEDNLIEVADSQ
ncbi:MAG: M1 family aminopeptidase [Pseudomonadota bacterium]